MAEKIVNKDVNYTGLKPRTVKNFYAIGRDKEGKSYIGVFENVNFIQARRQGQVWAKSNKLKLEGVYSN